MKKILMALVAVSMAGVLRADVPPAAKEILTVMETVADWQIANPSKHPTTDWTQGALFTGMMALDGISPSTRFREAMYAVGETNGWKTGPKVYHADDHVVGQMYCELFDRYREPKMLAGLRERFDGILAAPDERPIAGPVSAGKDKKTPMRWWWCDALFMGPPTLARFHAVTGDKKYRDFMVKEWKATSDFLYDKESGLYFRDSTYFTKKENNGAKVFWSRGNGWVMGGLVRVLQCLPEDDPDRDFFVAQFKEMSAAVLKCQQDDGLWHASLLDPQSFPLKEASGTGFFTYALTWGINQGLLDRAKFEPAVRKAWAGLVGCVATNGKLTHVQPIGADPRAFDEGSTEVYGVGSFLLAGSELYRLALLDASRGKCEVRVGNELDMLRPQETIEIGWNALKEKFALAGEHSVTVMDALGSRILDSQVLDLNQDQQPETLLFQSDFLPKQTKRFVVFEGPEKNSRPRPQLVTYGRFVPERYDDFAWENDRTAHRVYGPALMTAPKETGGSGIDVWSKKVRYPVIDKWYKSTKYHNDAGEGCDAYKVGLYRGCGGIGAVDRGKITYPMDFTEWKILANGPIRTVFTLQYPEWLVYAPQSIETNASKVLGADATNLAKLVEFNDRVAQQTRDEAEIKGRALKLGEKKTVSLDRGANMNRITSTMSCSSSDAFTFLIGIVQRHGEGDATKDASASWIAYTEPEAKPNGRIHCAIAMPLAWQPSLGEIDGHYTISASASAGQEVTYFAGAGWSKGLDFPDHKSWAAYVKDFAARTASPLKLEIK